MKLYEEYDWNEYTKIYSNQIYNMPETQFIIKNAKIENKKINWNGDNIHPNIKFIMEYILNITAKSVFECGFGGGQHIYSIKKLFPNIIVGGIELLESQVQFGCKHFNIEPEFYDERFLIGDWSIPNIYTQITHNYDLLYTNAVVMHLNTEKAVSFIKNMIGLNPKYIVMAEGTPNHNWNELYSLTNILEKYTIDQEIYKIFTRKN